MFIFKQKTAYEMRISDWSSDVCSSDLIEDSDATGVCVFQDDWHEGVVGLVASKVKDKLHRPTIAFARAQEGGLLKGSGRSIPGLHLRDALVLLDTRHPGLLQRYGGHAMAAGMTIAESDYETFAAAYDAICGGMRDADARIERAPVC